ncbi:MAG: WYL domain-containing protein [Ruaniaceae bacterium]|nr:WYL domain-containing protein [Ruaniaceae bacterium]
MGVSHPERILDLLIALGNTHVRMTKQQIRRQVAGYGSDDAAFERMFERDKDLLRSIGVPIVVDRDAVHEDDVGYRIDLDAYSMDLTLTPEEIGALSVARELHGGAWRDAARRGVTKVRAIGQAADLDAPGMALELAAPSDALDALCEAIARRRRVTFTYTGLSSPTRERTIEPWRVVAQRRGWYVLGRDTDSGEQRRFRLTRIRGKVTESGPDSAYEIPPHTLDPPRQREVVLAVVKDRASSLRARGVVSALDDERDLLRLTIDDPIGFAREAAGFGADAVVVEPADIREAVLWRLRRARGVVDYA